MKKIIILICFLFTNSFVSAKLNIGNKSPGFILSDINGNRISVTAILADNKPIILAYFATWCQPCLKEIPHLQNIQSKSNVKVYLINIDGLNKEKIKEFLTKNNITFPVLLDPEAKITGENFEDLKADRANIPKLFLISADAADAIADLIFKIYEIMNYDAICIGYQELSYEKFVSYINKYKLAFLSSNVNYCLSHIPMFLRFSLKKLLKN